MAILEHIRNIILYRLHVNGSQGGNFSNSDSGMARIILRIEISNLEKNRFLRIIFQNSPEDQWPL